MAIENTIVLIKPHALKNDRWVYPIVKRYQAAGLLITSLHYLRMSAEEVAQFYAEHRDKDFFFALVTAMCEGHLLALCLSGQDAISKVRELNGATNPDEAKPGTIRHDFRGPGGPRNTVHGSDSVQSSLREYSIIFKD